MMIELTHEQVRALLGFVSSAKSLLSQMETANRPLAAVRDETIDDCDQWRDLLLRKLDTPSCWSGSRD